MIGSDPIGSLQHHLVVYSKSLADSLYAIEHASSLSPSDYTLLRDGILKAADDLDRLVKAVPDYASLVGPRKTLLSYGKAYNDQVSATIMALEIDVKNAEAKLGTAAELLRRALEGAISK